VECAVSEPPKSVAAPSAWPKPEVKPKERRSVLVEYSEKTIYEIIVAHRFDKNGEAQTRAFTMERGWEHHTMTQVMNWIYADGGRPIEGKSIIIGTAHSYYETMNIG
jgi:hypothetical protein